MAVLPIYPGTNPFASMRIKTTWPLHPDLAAQITAVRFLDNTGPYRGGERATFLPADVDALVAAGLAVAA